MFNKKEGEIETKVDYFDYNTIFRELNRSDKYFIIARTSKRIH